MPTFRSYDCLPMPSKFPSSRTQNKEGCSAIGSFFFSNFFFVHGTCLLFFLPCSAIVENKRTSFFYFLFLKLVGPKKKKRCVLFGDRSLLLVDGTNPWNACPCTIYFHSCGGGGASSHRLFFHHRSDAAAMLMPSCSA